MVAKNLLDQLKEKQTKEDLSDHKFAKKLNTSYQLWQMTRTGDRDIGLTILRGTRAYPDLALAVLIFLGFDVVKVTELLCNATAYHQTHQNKILGALRKFFDALLKRDGK